MSLAENIARTLGNGKEKKNGGGWLTCCPAHGDAKPSLSITDSADGIAVHCHAGCGYS
jgi:DNA primase